MTSPFPGILLCLLLTFAPLLNAGEVLVPFGQRSVRFTIVDSPVKARGPLLISLHSNETTSVAAAQQLIGTYAGRMAIIDGGGQRRIPLYDNSNRVTLDPNRAFSLVGIKRDLDRFSIYSEKDAHQCVQFGQAILKSLGISDTQPVIALHNNTNGGYSIESYEKGGSEAAAAEKISRNGGDPDNFFLVTHPQLFEDLKNAKFNVVLQSKNAPDDGSLSVYCGKQGITYVNVESERGKLEIQRAMLEAVLRLIGNPSR